MFIYYSLGNYLFIIKVCFNVEYAESVKITNESSSCYNLSANRRCGKTYG